MSQQPTSTDLSLKTFNAISDLYCLKSHLEEQQQQHMATRHANNMHIYAWKGPLPH